MINFRCVTFTQNELFSFPWVRFDGRDFLFVFINTLPQVHSYTCTRFNKEEIFVSSFSCSNFSSQFGVTFSYFSFESSIKGCSYQLVGGQFIWCKKKSNNTKSAKKPKTKRETKQMLAWWFITTNHRWRNQRKTWDSTAKSEPKK